MLAILERSKQPSNIMNSSIAAKLNVLESAIIRIEEWAHVLFVVVKGLGARFVSKEVVNVSQIEEVKIECYIPGNRITLSLGTNKKVLNGITAMIREDGCINRFQFHGIATGWTATDKQLLSDRVTKAWRTANCLPRETKSAAQVGYESDMESIHAMEDRMYSKNTHC